MDVSVAKAKDRFTELLRAVEQGEIVVITRHGKPVAQLGPAPRERRKIRVGSMRGQIKFHRGWNKPMSEEDFLAGRF
jgi:prevent-host-death family protein